MPDKQPEYCPVHEQFTADHRRLCNKVDWIIKLMLTNLGAAVITLISVVVGLIVIIAKIAIIVKGG